MAVLVLWILFKWIINSVHTEAEMMELHWKQTSSKRELGDDGKKLERKLIMAALEGEKKLSNKTYETKRLSIRLISFTHIPHSTTHIRFSCERTMKNRF